MHKSRSQEIFDHALKFATPFSTTLGHPWAIIPDGSNRYHGWPIHSTRFREWLAHGFHHEHSLWPGSHAMDSAVRMMAAHAHHSEFPVSDVFTRLGCTGDRLNPQAILFHLANAANEVVEITPGGHRILSGNSWRFLAAHAAAPLPRPVDTTATVSEQLEPLLGISATALHRAVVWLFAALRPTGPFPVLVISGPPTSGKSTLARTLRALIDPSATPLLSPPSSERNLFTLALHNRILAFDHITRMPRNIADCIARLSTGTGLGLQPLALERPVIIGSAGPWPATTFSNNAIRIQLNAPRLENLRTQTSLAKQLESAAPSILGALCQAVSTALSNISSVETPAVSQVPDVHQWTTAAAPILGLTPEQINSAVASNPLVNAMHALLEGSNEWTGTATELIRELNLAITPEYLSEQLNALPLALFGLSFESWMSHRQRRIRLARTLGLAVSKAAA